MIAAWITRRNGQPGLCLVSVPPQISLKSVANHFRLETEARTVPNATIRFFRIVVVAKIARSCSLTGPSRSTTKTDQFPLFAPAPHEKVPPAPPKPTLGSTLQPVSHESKIALDYSTITKLPNLLTFLNYSILRVARTMIFLSDDFPFVRIVYAATHTVGDRRLTL